MVCAAFIALNGSDVYFLCILVEFRKHGFPLSKYYIDTISISFVLFASVKQSVKQFVKHRFRRCKSDSDYNYVPYSYHPTLKDLEENLRPRSTILTKAFFSVAHGLQGPKKSLKSQDQGARDGRQIREDKDDPKTRV